MTKSTVYKVQVMFGDCDPAGIVFFPNYLKWMDAASLHFFMECGVPPWRDYEKLTGIIGTPLLEIKTNFHKSATYGEHLEVHTTIDEWRSKVVIQRHRVFRQDRDGPTLLCDGTEVRAFVQRLGDGRLKAVPVPEEVRQKCA